MIRQTNNTEKPVRATSINGLVNNPMIASHISLPNRKVFYLKFCSAVVTITGLSRTRLSDSVNMFVINHS
jgi:hypothetical protein